MSGITLSKWEAFHPLDKWGEPITTECFIEAVAKDGISNIKLKAHSLGIVSFGIFYKNSYLTEKSEVLEFKIDQNEPIKIQNKIQSDNNFFSIFSQIVNEKNEIVMDRNFKLLIDQMKTGKELKFVPQNGKLLVFSLENFEDCFDSFFEVNEKRFINSKKRRDFFYLYRNSSQN